MNKATDVEGKVRAIIYDKLRVEEKDITLQSHFINDLGADSLDTVDLIMEFEKEFNITIPDAAVEKMNTVGEAVEYIRNALSKKIVA